MEGHIVFEYYDGIFSKLSFYLGCFLTFFTYCVYCRKVKFTFKNILFSFLLLFVIGLSCGELGYRIFYHSDIEKFGSLNPCVFKIFHLGFFRDNTIGFINTGANSGHGMILGIIIAASIFGFILKKNILAVLDCCIIPICLFLITWRISNLFNIENFGLPTEKSWGVVFSDIDNLPRHATMLYEAIWVLFVTVFLIFLSKKCSPFNRNNEITYKHGFLFFSGIFLIYFMRFFIEMIKMQKNLMSNPVLDYLHLNMSQLLSVCFFVPALVFVIYLSPNESNLVE